MLKGSVIGNSLINNCNSSILSSSSVSSLNSSSEISELLSGRIPALTQLSMIVFLVTFSQALAIKLIESRISIGGGIGHLLHRTHKPEHDFDIIICDIVLLSYRLYLDLMVEDVRLCLVVKNEL